MSETYTFKTSASGKIVSFIVGIMLDFVLVGIFGFFILLCTVRLINDFQSGNYDLSSNFSPPTLVAMIVICVLVLVTSLVILNLALFKDFMPIWQRKRVVIKSKGLVKHLGDIPQLEYQIFVEGSDKKFQVTYEMYNAVSIGDEADIEFEPYMKEIRKMTLYKKNRTEKTQKVSSDNTIVSGSLRFKYGIMYLAIVLVICICGFISMVGTFIFLRSFA